MIFGLSHVDVPVTDLRAALRLYTEQLGFSEKKRGPGFVDLDGGSCLVRLVETGRVEHPVMLRLAVREVEGVARTLAGAGFRVLYEPQRFDDEQVAQLADADGNTLIVWRELSEDERKVVPELPKQRGWEPEAEQLLKALLRRVPVLFRALARRRVTANAEELAHEAGRVGRLHVIRAYILSSARVTRYRLRQPLEEQGVCPEDFREDFEREERL
jgi:catechol 2,3-dioxygenase-like lactoylglutathione lyase family enzyme